MFITRGDVDDFVVDVFEDADWRFGGERVHCFEDEADVRTGVNFRMRGAFALQGGAATLTGGALKPCYGAIALLVGALSFHLRWTPLPRQSYQVNKVCLIFYNSFPSSKSDKGVLRLTGSGGGHIIILKMDR